MTYPGQPQPGGAPNYGPPPGNPQGYQQGYPQSGYPQASYPQVSGAPAGYPQPGYPQVTGYPQGGYAVQPPVPRAPNGMPLANFGDRLVAVLIDAAVLFGVALVLAIPTFIAMFAIIAGAAASASAADDTSSAGLIVGVPLLLELLLVVLIFVAHYVYNVEMFGRTGVTWGKRAMKLQLLRIDSPGAPIDRGTLAKRWATQTLVGGIVPFFSWIDGLWQLWDKPYQQCLHDKAAGTIVVKVG